MGNPHPNLDNLKSYKPGQSGNPAGKPKGIPNSKTRLLRLLQLTEQLKNPVTGVVEGFTVAEQLDLAQIMLARKGDTKAYNTILDRLEGKAAQSVDVTTNGKDVQVPIYGGLSGKPEDVSISRYHSNEKDIPASQED